MTVVVADASPLNYLVLIGEVGLLPRLYTRLSALLTAIEALSRASYIR
jgi:hypothetical protein